MLKTSARNRLLGTVIGITPGAVNDEIRLRIAGGQTSPPPSPAKAPRNWAWPTARKPSP